MSAEKERENGGFTVRDRRVFGDEAGADAAPAPDDAAASSSAPEGRETGAAPREPVSDAPGTEPLPPIDFGTFVLSLSTSAMYHLGAIPDPETQEPRIDLPLAKQTIDIIAMLKGKTEGNRSDEESRLLDGLLYDLRIRYVDAASRK